MFRLAGRKVVVDCVFFGIEPSCHPLRNFDLPNNVLRRHAGDGYGHVLQNVEPMMHRCGFTGAEIETIPGSNPGRLRALP